MSDCTSGQPHVGVTGARGFVGQHLVARLKAAGCSVTSIPRHAWASDAPLATMIASCDALVHLAGMNRGDDQAMYETNVQLARTIRQAISRSEQRPHVLFASSTLRTQESAYGRSKRESESILAAAADELGFPLTILVVPNVFGPGGQPYYNSVVSTFCHQLAHGEVPQIIEDRELELISVGDLCDTMVRRIRDRAANSVTTLAVPGSAKLCVSQLLQLLRTFHGHFFGDGVIPLLHNQLERQLYATLLSHVDPADHCHVPQVHRDERGSLFEIIRTAGGGQVFFSTTRPGVVRGNHFHTRKIEWFCVVRGEALIRLRRVGHEEVHEFRVSGKQPEFVSIPALHTHSIENVGQEDLLTMFWTSELFESSDPDTYFEKVA